MEEDDIVRVYRDDADEWRWQRLAGGNNEVIADSGEGYVKKRDAMQGALRANAGPYLLELDGSIELAIDTTGQVTAAYRDEGAAVLSLLADHPDDVTDEIGDAGPAEYVGRHRAPEEPA